jgi:hypothetical protein
MPTMWLLALAQRGLQDQVARGWWPPIHPIHEFLYPPGRPAKHIVGHGRHHGGKGDHLGNRRDDLGHQAIDQAGWTLPGGAFPAGDVVKSARCCDVPAWALGPVPNSPGRLLIKTNSDGSTPIADSGHIVFSGMRHPAYIAEMHLSADSTFSTCISNILMKS